MSRERLVSGASWSDFCDRLRDAGNAVLRGPDDELTRAEGFRYVARVTRAALEVFLENKEAWSPTLSRVVHETVKMGADNPDNHYLHAPLDGRVRYVIRGTRGTIQYLTFSTQIGHYGQGRGMPPTGHLDAKDLVLAPDGSFAIDLAIERPAGSLNWLPMTAETATLIVRQTRLTPTEQWPTLAIERLGPRPEVPALRAEAVDDALGQAGMLVAGATMLFASWADGFKAHENTLPRFDQALSNAMGGVPDIAYYHSYWRLAPDEALVIEHPGHPCDHWNFQLNNHWMESLDYRYHIIHTNSGLAIARPGGGYRVVVAHEDPGVPNWVRTAGHAFGTMCFRWVRPDGDPPTPTTRVMKRADVAGLPQ